MKMLNRYVLAICFMLSGVLKLFSLHAFGQEVQLYADAYVGMWPHDYAWCIAVAVCVFELVLGIFALSRRWALLTAVAFFVVVGFFVYLTGMNLFFPTMMGSIESCGCFGELIHFTPVSSFVKSLVLWGLAIWLLCSESVGRLRQDRND